MRRDRRYPIILECADFVPLGYDLAQCCGGCHYEVDENLYPFAIVLPQADGKSRPRTEAHVCCGVEKWIHREVFPRPDLSLKKWRIFCRQSVDRELFNRALRAARARERGTEYRMPTLRPDGTFPFDLLSKDVEIEGGLKALWLTAQRALPDLSQEQIRVVVSLALHMGEIVTDERVARLFPVTPDPVAEMTERTRAWAESAEGQQQMRESIAHAQETIDTFMTERKIDWRRLHEPMTV